MLAEMASLNPNGQIKLFLLIIVHLFTEESASGAG